MAQVLLLKISADGVPLEFDSAVDDITLNSFTAGAGPVMSPTGIDMNGQDVTDISDLVFTAPTVGTINQTFGALIIDNIMAKDRPNVLTTAADVLFPVVTNTAGQVDAFRLPAIAGTPTATPTATGEGFVVWDSTGDKMYIWDGAAWQNQTSTTSVENIYTAGAAIAARDVVYISSADNVSPALGNATSQAYAIGLATASASSTNPVTIQSEGVLSGFSGLTAGSRYYLSAGTPGAITATIPTGTGNTMVQIGYARSTTKLHLHIQQLGRRA